MDAPEPAPAAPTSSGRPWVAGLLVVLGLAGLLWYARAGAPRADAPSRVASSSASSGASGQTPPASSSADPLEELLPAMGGAPAEPGPMGAPIAEGRDAGR